MEPGMPDGTWMILVEENTRIGGWAGDANAWRLTQIVPLSPGADVRDVARDMAYRFKPQRPMSPRRRSVFKINDYSWLVRVVGATSEHHFKVTAARHVAELDGEGRPVGA